MKFFNIFCLKKKFEPSCAANQQTGLSSAGPSSATKSRLTPVGQPISRLGLANLLCVSTARLSHVIGSTDGVSLTFGQRWARVPGFAFPRSWPFRNAGMQILYRNEERESIGMLISRSCGRNTEHISAVTRL